MATISRFVQLLEKKLPAGPGMFNPWRDYDRENEIGSEGPAIRRRQLEHYLEARAGKARYILIAEAFGYQGGHFTGIAMTSERILLGHLAHKGVQPRDVLPSLKPERTSKPELRPTGFNEPTATIVWSHLLACGFRGSDFVLWNAVPWQPYHLKKGLLSNRTPSADEEARGMDVLGEIRVLFPRSEIIALGKVSQRSLAASGCLCKMVRHPAMGGATLFRNQMSALLLLPS